MKFYEFTKIISSENMIRVVKVFVEYAAKDQIAYPKNIYAINSLKKAS
jgi:hypothetical protein